MTKKEFKTMVEEVLELGDAYFKTNEEDSPAGVLYLEANEDVIVANFIDGVEDYRYEFDEDDIASLINEMWEELGPEDWEQINEEEYESIMEEY